MGGRHSSVLVVVRRFELFFCRAHTDDRIFPLIWTANQWGQKQQPMYIRPDVFISTNSNCSIKLADYLIRARILWNRKRPRCQLCHNHCPLPWSVYHRKCLADEWVQLDKRILNLCNLLNRFVISSKPNFEPLHRHIKWNDSALKWLKWRDLLTQVYSTCTDLISRAAVLVSIPGLLIFSLFQNVRSILSIYTT